MGSLDFPEAGVSVDAQATAAGVGDGYVAVIAPVHTLDDGVPRLYSGGKAAMAAHGYSPGVSYAALHAQHTRRPFLLVGIPIATPGVSSAVADHSATGTCVITLTDDAVYGCLTEINATLTVVTGGTIGVAGIVLSLTLDGGGVTKTIRLGTANSYTIPDLGVVINFAAGTLVAAEYYTWTATGPMWDSTGLALARTELAKKSYAVKTWLVGGLCDPTAAALVATQASNYASANSRFVSARATTTALAESTWAAEATAQAASYAAVNSTDGRLSLGFGRRRIMCPLTGWAFRRSPAWAASLREYERAYDIHNTTWWRKRGPLTDWYTLAADADHDERTDSGALAGRFTCFTTLSNDTGVYLAKDLSRAADDSVLLLPSNVLVTNAVCTVVQTETERVLGGDLLKKADNTIDENQAVDIEEAVNSALKRGLVKQHVPGRGRRVSSVRWTLSRDDDLSGASATLTGVADLNVRGVVSQVTTTVKVQ